MDTFARETFKLGTLRGFKHFRVELRGREEMLLMFEVHHAALNGTRLTLAPMNLQSALPPASPCQRERIRAPWEDAPAEPESSTVSYLLAGYAHYNCPLAWVRSGHSLFGPSFQSPAAMDAPCDLQTSAEFKQRTVHAFEFAAELVFATARPAPANPFEIDLAMVEKLPLVEMLLLAGSLASFLRDIQLSNAPYAHLVESGARDGLTHTPEAPERFGRPAPSASCATTVAARRLTRVPPRLRRPDSSAADTLWPSAKAAHGSRFRPTRRRAPLVFPTLRRHLAPNPVGGSARLVWRVGSDHAGRHWWRSLRSCGDLLPRDARPCLSERHALTTHAATFEHSRAAAFALQYRRAVFHRWMLIRNAAHTHALVASALPYNPQDVRVQAYIELRAVAH